jgi:DNA-binding NtrC family response regulator
MTDRELIFLGAMIVQLDAKKPVSIADAITRAMRSLEGTDQRLLLESQLAIFDGKLAACTAEEEPANVVEIRDRLMESIRSEIMKALTKARGNVTIAAAFLGVKRTTLTHKIKVLGLRPMAKSLKGRAA